MAYTKQNFEDGQVLKAEHLNKIEQGIEDASVQTDWNQTDETAADFIKNKPFGDYPTGSDTLTIPAHTEQELRDLLASGEIVVASGELAKVCDSVPTMADLSSGLVMYSSLYGTVEVSAEGFVEIAEGVLLCQDATALFVEEKGVGIDIDGILFPEPGIYLPSDFFLYGVVYTIPGYTGFPLTETLDERYLPDSVKPGAIILHVDANAGDPYLYKDRMSSLTQDANGRVTRAEIENWVSLGKTIYALNFADSFYKLCVNFRQNQVAVVDSTVTNGFAAYFTAEYTAS